MLEPQSTAFFLLLMAVFGALVWWMVAARQTAFRVLAACLAFIPAMMFGVAAVNKYYDYYQTWGAAIADITNRGPANAVELPPGSVSYTRFNMFHGSQIDAQIAEQQGFVLHLRVTGAVSQITRSVYVYLPPQYFQPRYRHYRFPVIELLHGFPGLPQDWITTLGVNTILQNLDARGLASPAVLVMPDINGGRGISLQCLNQFHGPRDATFLAVDLPAYIAQKFRVISPGRAWGIAGYSEGGFCTANLGLQYGYRFGYAGVLSGYFKPSDNQFGHPPRKISPFGRNARLRRRNTPLDLLESLRPGAPVPQFWIGVGNSDHSDVANAEIFAQLVRQHQPAVQVRGVPGGHSMHTWRQLLAPMLEWMTPRLAAADHYELTHRQHRGPAATGGCGRAATGGCDGPARPGRRAIRGAAPARRAVAGHQAQAPGHG